MKSKNPFKFRVTVPLKSNGSDQITWLLKQWGVGGLQKTSHWTFDQVQNHDDEVTYCFRSEQDAAFFKLRWA